MHPWGPDGQDVQRCGKRRVTRVRVWMCRHDVLRCCRRIAGPCPHPRAPPRKAQPRLRTAASGRIRGAEGLRRVCKRQSRMAAPIMTPPHVMCVSMYGRCSVRPSTRPPRAGTASSKAVAVPGHRLPRPRLCLRKGDGEVWLCVDHSAIPVSPSDSLKSRPDHGMGSLDSHVPTVCPGSSHRACHGGSRAVHQHSTLVQTAPAAISTRFWKSEIKLTPHFLAPADNRAIGVIYMIGTFGFLCCAVVQVMPLSCVRLGRVGRGGV